MTTAYHRDQAGAPALVYGGSDPNFTALKTILKACLVSGYAGKPAAGWTLVAEGEKHIVLRNGSLSGYLCLTYIGTVIRAYVADTFTGIAGDVIVGDGVKSGVASGSTSPQAFNAQYIAYHTDYSSWSMVADDKTFVLSLSGYWRDGALVNPPTDTGLTIYAGEDSNGNFLVVGGAAATGTNGASVPGYFQGVQGITVLKNPATGLLVGAAALPVSTPSLNLVSPLNNVAVLIPVADMAPIRWVGGGVFGGCFRGLAHVPLLTHTASASPAANSLGFVGTMTYRAGGAPLVLGDGYTYFARMGHPSAPFFLLTDNPEFWL